jgi:cardiolipin synthase
VSPELGLDRIWTVPNALTALRLACLPVFVSLLAKPEGKGRAAAAFLLGGLGITDSLDGYVARRFHQVSSLGKMADPLVDRALVLTATGGALVVGAIPPWFVGVVLAREAVVAGGGAVLALSGGARLEVSRAGKIGAFGMMVALPLFILGSSSSRWRGEARTLGWVAAGWGQVFAWGAAAGYVPQAVAAFSERHRAVESETVGALSGESPA